MGPHSDECGKSVGLRDTLHGLKSGSFSAEPSYGHGCLACVWASTHNAQVMCDTIRDFRRRGQPAHVAFPEPREDVDLPSDVAVSLKTAGRAAEVAPPGLVAVTARRAGLARVLLVHQRDLHPLGGCLVRDGGADLAVVPAAHPAVVDLAFLAAVGDIPDVADGDRLSLAFDRRVHNGAADLVLDVAQDALVLGLHADLGPHEPPVSSGTLLLARDGLRHLAQPPGVSLALRPPLPAGDDRGHGLIADHGGMDLAEIDRHDIRARGLLRLLAVFDNQVRCQE